MADGVFESAPQESLWRQGTAWICLLACGAIVAGCASTGGLNPYFASPKSQANVYVSPGRAKVSKIAILPFKGPTELIGAAVSDFVVTEMSRTQRYTLVERSQMASVLSETELAMAGLSAAKAVEAARMLGADGVVIGTVDEYTMQAKGGKTYAVAGVSIRLIDCTNGQIVWSSDLAKMAGSASIPLAAHGRAVVHEVVSGLYQNWARQKNLSGYSTQSQAAPLAPVVPQAPPARPTGLTVSDMGLREAVLNWDNSGVTANRYRIERGGAEQGPFAAIAEVSPHSGSYKDSKGLSDNTAYYYRIVPLGADGKSGEVSQVVESLTAPPPDPPQQLLARAPASRCVALTWQAPRSEGVTRYRIGGTQERR